jgi:hypothetical protein
MRKINESQYIDYFIINKIKEIIKPGPITATDILLYLINKEKKYKESQTDLFYKQNILACYRYYFMELNPPKLLIDELNEIPYVKHLSKNIFKQLANPPLLLHTDVRYITNNLLDFFKIEINKLCESTIIPDEPFKIFIKELTSLIINSGGNSIDTAQNEEEEEAVAQNQEEDEEIEEDLEIQVNINTLLTLNSNIIPVYLENVDMNKFFDYDSFIETDICDISELSSFKPLFKYWVDGNIKIKQILNDVTGEIIYTNPDKSYQKIVIMCDYRFVHIIDNIYLFYTSYNVGDKITDKKQIERYIEVYDTREGENKNKLLYYALITSDDAINLTHFNTLNGNKYNFTIRLLNGDIEYSTPNSKKIIHDNINTINKSTLLETLCGNRMVNIKRLLGLLDYFKDHTTPHDRKRVFKYMRIDKKFIELYQNNISLYDFKNVMLIFKLIIDYNLVSTDKHIYRKIYSIDNFVELICDSLIKLQKCTFKSVRENYNLFFKNIGFSLDSPVTPEIIRYSEELLIKLKLIFRSFISIQNNDIVLLLTKKRSIIRIFWLEFKSYLGYSINYKKNLCDYEFVSNINLGGIVERHGRNTEFARRGGFKEKYLKYKKKYLALKEQNSFF